MSAASFRADTSASASARVDSGEKDSRTAPSSQGLGRPMAANTWLGFPLWQAEPEETQIPRSPSTRTTTSLLYPGREMAQMWGASPAEITSTRGTAFFSCSSVYPLMAAVRSRRVWSRPAASTAAAKAAIWAVASVPERRPSSCPPPVSSGRRRTPFFTYSAPIPLGAPILWPLTATRSAPSRARGPGTFKKPCTPSQWNRMAGS